MKEYQSGIKNCKIGKNVTIVHPINLYDCEIGDGTFVGPFCEIQKGAKIGKGCRIQSHTFICEGVTIDDSVFIGHGVMFINDKNPKVSNTNWKMQRTRILSGVSIGSNATILPTIIGSNSVVGAGSVVTKPVEKDKVVIGNPAKELRKAENKTYNHRKTYD